MAASECPALPPGYSIRQAQTASDLQSFARLALEYQQWLGLDLGFQAFDKELSSLPGCYSSPSGCILLLSYQPHPEQQPVDAGCVAVRPLHTNHTAHAGLEQQQQADMHESCHQQQPQIATDHRPVQPDLADACEMKRLWVKREHHGKGLGKALAAASIAAARQCGHSSMVLDTLQSLAAANKLYGQLGFVQRNAYYENPLPGVVYWERQL